MSRKNLMIITGPVHSHKHLIARRLAHYMNWLGYNVFQAPISLEDLNTTNKRGKGLLEQYDNAFTQNDIVILHGHEKVFNLSECLKIEAGEKNVFMVHSASAANFSKEDVRTEIMLSGINNVDAELLTLSKMEKKALHDHSLENVSSRRTLDESRVSYMYIEHGKVSNEEILSRIIAHTEVVSEASNFLTNLCVHRSDIYLLSPNKKMTLTSLKKVSKIVGEQPLHIFAGGDEKYVSTLEVLRGETIRPACNNMRNDGGLIVRSFDDKPTKQNLEGLSKKEISEGWLNNPAIDQEYSKLGLNTDAMSSWEVANIILQANEAVFDAESPFSYRNQELSEIELSAARKAWPLMFEGRHDAKIGIGSTGMKDNLLLYFTGNSATVNDESGGTLVQLAPKDGSFLYDSIHHSV